MNKAATMGLLQIGLFLFVIYLIINALVKRL